MLKTKFLLRAFCRPYHNLLSLAAAKNACILPAARKAAKCHAAMQGPIPLRNFPSKLLFIKKTLIFTCATDI